MNKRAGRRSLLTVSIPVSIILCIVSGVLSRENEVTKRNTGREGSPPSIFFIIDHSGSMFNTSIQATDQWGNRFRVTRDFIDTVLAICPAAEVGIAVFRQQLYFDPVDDARFVQCPEQDTGAYLPLLRLDSTYTPEGKKGYEILQGYMETDTVDTIINPYVDLVYVPTNTVSNQPSTHINAAIQMASGSNSDIIQIFTRGQQWIHRGDNRTADRHGI